MILCMIFRHGFGLDGFRSMFLDTMVFQSMVMDALASINMYCNIERNIMENQAGSPGFGIQGKIYVYVFYVLCSRIVYFLCFRIRMQVISVWGLNLHLVSEFFWLQGDAFAVEGFCSGLW